MRKGIKEADKGAGHRKRLRSRFLAQEEEALSDVHLIELLLTYSIPRKDVFPLANSLLDKFGSIQNLVKASAEDLESVTGLKESSVILIKLLNELINKVPGTPAEKPKAHYSKTGEASNPADSSTPRLVEESSPAKPKLQVSGGYTFDPTQTASYLTHISERPHIKRFVRKDIMEETGMTERQAESLASVSTALGLVTPRTQVLTNLGKLIVKHDLFFDSPITLEFLHFLGAGTPKNLIWFTVFSELLHDRYPMDQAGWSAWLRERFSGLYSSGSLIKHIAHEVRFVIDTYTQRNFKKLKILREEPDGKWALQSLLSIRPHVLAASIYHFAKRFDTELVPFNELHQRSGSPGRVFGLASSQLRELVESLHQKGWVRFEVRHGLDQVRLVEGFAALSFIEADFENRDPERKESLNEEVQFTLL